MAKSQNICFYPQLSDEMYEHIFDGDESSVSFSYLVNGKTNPVEFNDINDNISFDCLNNWNCDDYDLDVSIYIKLKNLDILFGKNGISPSNAKIGLCIEWYSAQSKIRKIINPNENKLISKTDKEQVYTFDFILPKQTFIGSVSLNALLYLAKPADIIEDEEQFLNNNSGVIIGNILKKVIFMTGDGSQFPIKVLPMPNCSLLWNLELNLDEPGSRQISDGITLILNSAHKDYKFIDPNSEFYCDRLANEIVTNALILFLDELSKSSEFDLDGNYEEGTLLSYAQYCKNCLDVKFDGLMSISKSIHEFSERGE